MGISGVSSNGADYSKYNIEQQTQKQEVEKLEAEQNTTVQKVAQPQESGAKPESGSSDQSGSPAQSALSAVSSASGQISQQLTSSEDEDDDEQALINKANSGSVLTASELSRLKEADPALYSRVVKADQAREELRNQMKQNPSGAGQAARTAIAKNNSENQDITRKALSDEYASFASKYDQIELSGNVQRYW